MSTNSEFLHSIVQNLPNEPGVYQFLDENNKIIYIGKAKNLKKRVASYFSKNFDNSKTAILVKKITNIQYIVVETETDALLLENNLIKKYQPHYNVLLKDDKSYPLIAIRNESFARVFYTRKKNNDNSIYFGPFTSITLVRTMMELFKQLFLLRNCNLSLTSENISKQKYRVCLEFHIGNCKGACVGRQSLEEYNANIKQIQNILKGNSHKTVNFFKKQMEIFAEKLEFEKAHSIKTKLNLLKTFQSKSTVVHPNIHNVDVFSIAEDEKCGFVNFLKIMNGKIIQVRTFEMRKKLNETKEELLTLAIAEIYQSNQMAKEIILPFKIEVNFPSVQKIIPQKGDKKKLLELSQKNATYFRLEKLKMFSKMNPQQHTQKLLEQMQKDLTIKQLPIYIECFDNSNLQGTNPVASCVVFRNAKPSKKEYRHFNIKTVAGIDDFASMQEIVFRRYQRLILENQPLPNLIVIDGGKGQLSAAMQSLEKLNIHNQIDVISIAKRLEEIFLPNDSIPLYMEKNSETLKIIQHIRNEAHRFGIKFHRNKRSKEFLHSEFDEIKGIGQKTLEKLLSHFKTLENVKNATFSEIKNIIGKQKAQIIAKYFNISL